MIWVKRIIIMLLVGWVWLLSLIEKATGMNIKDVLCREC